MLFYFSYLCDSYVKYFDVHTCHNEEDGNVDAVETCKVVVDVVIQTFL